jgi:hypothetical protein
MGRVTVEELGGGRRTAVNPWPWLTILFLVVVLLGAAGLGKHVRATASPDTRVLLVAPGQRVNVGEGSSLWLTRTQMCVESSGTTQCGPVAFGGNLSLSYSSASPVTGLYAGTDAQNITISDGRHRYAAILVRLRSHPDVTAYALDLSPTDQSSCQAQLHVTVMNAAGHVLVQTSPATHGSGPGGLGGSSNCAEFVVSFK